MATTVGLRLTLLYTAFILPILTVDMSSEVDDSQLRFCFAEENEDEHKCQKCPHEMRALTKDDKFRGCRCPGADVDDNYVCPCHRIYSILSYHKLHYYCSDIGNNQIEINFKCSRGFERKWDDVGRSYCDYMCDKDAGQFFELDKSNLDQGGECKKCDDDMKPTPNELEYGCVNKADWAYLNSEHERGITCGSGYSVSDDGARCVMEAWLIVVIVLSVLVGVSLITGIIVVIVKQQ